MPEHQSGGDHAKLGGSKLMSPVDMKRLSAFLNPKTKFLLDSRLVRIEWLQGDRWDPWFDLRIFRMGHFSVHLEVGRFYARWAPIPRRDWRRMKAEGTRGARWRNANVAAVRPQENASGPAQEVSDA